MKRSILIVTPYFAPQSHAAVFRAYKLAKLLPRFGWKPFVLTVDTNYLYNEDQSLLSALPPEVEVVTARYVEPTGRGLRMAMGGKDRTFAALKRRGEVRVATDEAVAEVASTRGRSLRTYLRERWLQSPDAYWTWYGPAVRAARRLIHRHDIPIVFTSANPYTCHRIGLTLQAEGCKWVADLRDPHTYCHHMHSRFASVFARQRGLEGRAVSRADAVTVASSAIGMILSDTYGSEGARRARFIPTGLDEELIPTDEEAGPPPRPYPYLLFAGEFLPDYGDAFLDVFAAALDRAEVRGLGAKLLIVGRMEVNAPIVLPMARRLGISDHVELVDHVPQGGLYRLLRGAEAGVLLTARHFRWWCLYAKLVDYLALRKPVVALVPDPSEARTRLDRAGLGVFLDGDRSACAEVLAGFLLGRSSRPRPVAEECDRYLATSQVSSFVSIFEDLIGPD